jgi:transposase
MSGFIEGEDRHQATLFPESLDEYIAEDSAVRVIDVFMDDLDISGLGFKTEPADTGRPGYHPKIMLKLYVYGYLNRVQSSRRLEREAQRNVELMWLTGRLAPDFKTIADFRKDNGIAIRLVCRGFNPFIADAFEKADNGRGGASCEKEEITRRSLSVKQSPWRIGRV